MQEKIAASVLLSLRDKIIFCAIFIARTVSTSVTRGSESESERLMYTMPATDIGFSNYVVSVHTLTGFAFSYWLFRI